MNYTEKYHLPQWEETDRIMRTDFNQMCADMEAGLTANAEAAGGLAVRIDQVEQETKDLVETGGSNAKASLLQGLFRVAWNHYFHLLDAEKDLWQSGVFTQSFARGAEGKAAGMLQQENMVWTGQYQDEPGADAVSSAWKVQTMADTGNTYSFSFNAQRGMRATGIKLTGDVNWPSGTANKYTVRLVNKGKNTVDAEIHATLNLISSARYVIPVDFVLHANQAYQIDITREEQEFPQVWLTSFSDYLEMGNTPNTTGVATLTTKDNEPNMGGLLIAHYTSWGAGGTLSLDWDGEVLAPAAVRTITGKDGRIMQAAEFRRTSEVPASSTMKLTLACEEGGEMELFRIGGILV